MQKTATQRIALGALLAGAALAVLPLRGYGLSLNDEGWLLHPALRMGSGEVLYRDVWVHYAPLRYHLLDWLFSLTGPSLIAARGLLAAMILASVAGIFLLARRFAPVWLAWVPAATYALVPGPWHKAPYTLCTIGFLLASVRALERPGAARLLALGGAVGLTLITRHELGLLQLPLALLVAARSGSRAGGALAPGAAERLGSAGLVAAGAALPCLAVVASYAWHGALQDLGEALFVRAFAQVEGGSVAHLRRLFSPASLGTAIEGRAAGAVILAPLIAYPVFAALLWRRWRRHGADNETVFGAVLLLTAAAALPQAFAPPLIARFLQSAAPFYLVCTWLVAACVRTTRSRVAQPVGAVASIASAAVLVWVVVAGIPRVDPSDAYTGSLRMRRASAAVRVPGGEVLTDWRTVEEIRLVRAFVDTHAEPHEPIFTAPWLSLYYVLLERPNPTRYVFERMRRGDFAMSGAMKSAEMKRLLASDTRYALVLARWWFAGAEGDAVRRTLRESFGPVRDYGGVVVLERSADPDRRELTAIHERVRRGRATRADVELLLGITEADPEQPLPAQLLGGLLLETDDTGSAIALLERAARLDPANPAPLERLADWHLRAGHAAEAASAASRARAVRDSPALRALRSAGASRAGASP